MANGGNSYADPLDSLLSLEDQYYTEGYTLGLADGAKAGRIEGRLFGLQNGFSKHLELGRLRGRANVWTARLSHSEDGQPDQQVRALNASERLKKHISRLSDLTDPSTLSTENTEDAVEEFESRLKDARAKATLISKAMGETPVANSTSDEAGAASNASGSKGLKVATTNTRGSGEMEDFAGGVPISKRKSKRTDES